LTLAHRKPQPVHNPKKIIDVYTALGNAPGVKGKSVGKPRQRDLPLLWLTSEGLPPHGKPGGGIPFLGRAFQGT
jgi:hypothetical protein